MKKILIISSCIGTFGGIEAFVLQLAKIIQKSHQFDVEIIWKKAKGYTSHENFVSKCTSINIPQHFLMKAGSELFFKIKNADVIHAQNQPPDVAFFCKLLKKPLVLTIHNYKKFSNLRSHLGRWSQKSAERRWYNSEFVRRSWEGKAIIPESKVIPTVSEMQEKYIEPSLRKGFLFAGRWIQNKGIDVLIEAYEMLQINRDEWPLILIGEGPLRDVYSMKYKLPKKNITCPGFVSEELKADYIAHAKWLVAPSHTNEDMGLTPIEARVCGVPAIVTEDGGLPESGGKEAIFCKPGDVISLRNAMEKAIQMSAEEYQLRSHQTKESLKTYLVPPHFYLLEYEKLLA